MNRRSLGCVQHLGLDKGLVDDARHLAAERVHFAHKVTFRCASYVRIARHHRDMVDMQREDRGFQAQAGACESSLTSRMACAYHDDMVAVFIFPYRICRRFHQSDSLLRSLP